tara:strand:- start:164 stop:409 length:246 start_codon:yes stop_codon:yes gene_type:complete
MPSIKVWELMEFDSEYIDNVTYAEGKESYIEGFEDGYNGRVHMLDDDIDYDCGYDAGCIARANRYVARDIVFVYKGGSLYV